MIKNKKHAIIHYLLIYLMLLFQGSVMIKVYQDIILVLGMAVCALIMVFKPVCSLKMKENFMLVVPTLLLLVITSLVSGGSLSVMSIGNVCVRLLVAVAVVNYDRKHFASRYVKLVGCFAVISIIGFGIQLVAPQVFTTLFPKNGTMYNASPLFVYAYKIHTKRNIGIYGEPGLYIIVLMTALYFLLFCNKRCGFTVKESRWLFLILLATVVTTMSTTGYIILVCVLACWYIKRTSKKNSNFKCFVVVLGAAVICVDLLMGTEGFVWKTIVEKMFNTSGELDLSQSTGNARIVSMLADLEVVKRYPWGAGFTTYEQLWRGFLIEDIYDVSSCMGITKGMATYGLPAVICYYVALANMSIRNHKDVFGRIACVLIFLLTTSTQPDIFYPAMISMFMIGDELKEKLK